MCKYCEKEEGIPVVIEHGNDLCQKPYVGLNIDENNKLGCDVETLCDDDYYDDEINVTVKINYCPMCGKKLKKK